MYLPFTDANPADSPCFVIFKGVIRLVTVNGLDSITDL